MKNILSKLNSESGLTLVELFVALLLVSLLMVIVVSGNLFVNRFLSNWENDNKLFEDGRFILLTISQDIKKSNKLKIVDSTGFILFSNTNDSIVYKIDNKFLYKNSKIINNQLINCDKMIIEIINFEKNTPDSILIDAKMDYWDKLVSIKLNLSYKNLTEMFETAVRLQNENNIY